MTKISIIVPSYNQSFFLPKTIDSILNQSPFHEILIVDGNSSDGTLNYLKSITHSKVSFASEPDKGQTHAINKGFRKATGDIVCWTNSDDIYLPGALARVAEEFSRDPNLDVLCGDKLHIDENGKPIELQRYAPYWIHTFANEKMMMCNQACFWRRPVFDKIGYLDESIRFVMDLEFFIRMGVKADLKIKHLPELWGAQRYYEGTKTSDPEWNKVWISERETVLRKYGLKRSRSLKLQSMLRRAFYHIRTGNPKYLFSNKL